MPEKILLKRRLLFPEPVTTAEYDKPGISQQEQTA